MNDTTELMRDRVALVTGASSGIGRALTLELARCGATVIAMARRRERLEALVGEGKRLSGKILPQVGDVTVRDDVEATVRRWLDELGPIDLLVNNAGRGHFAYVEETPQEQIESMFGLNVFPLWYTTSAILPSMRRRRSGTIVNIASMAGKIGFPANAAYVAAKHAVVGFTRALRTELAGSGVTAFCVLPGGTLTEWADVAEGGEMAALFAAEREEGPRIAREMGIELPPPMPLLGPDEVAASIVAALEDPPAELYTHPGSRELALAYQQDQERVERRLEPLWRAGDELRWR